MVKFKCFAAVVIIPFLSACAQEPVAMDAQRAEQSALFFFNDAATQGPVVDQVAALNEAADSLVETSRFNGALMGAALGCGVTLMTGSSAQSCVTRAAVAGAGGALVGQARGEGEVARRVELVSANDMAREINRATTQFDSVRAALPAHIADQEAALNRLTMQLLRGEIDQAIHDREVLRIAEDRAALSDALLMSARDARQARDNLRRAQARGQDGLDWHIDATDALADGVESSRSSFSLL